MLRKGIIEVVGGNLLPHHLPCQLEVLDLPAATSTMLGSCHGPRCQCIAKPPGLRSSDRPVGFEYIFRKLFCLLPLQGQLQEQLAAESALLPELMTQCTEMKAKVWQLLRGVAKRTRTASRPGTAVGTSSYAVVSNGEAESKECPGVSELASRVMGVE